MTQVQSILLAGVCIAGVMLMISMLVPADALERLYAWAWSAPSDPIPEANAHRAMPWERTRARVSDDLSAGYTHLQEDDACQCVECAPLVPQEELNRLYSRGLMAPSLSARLEAVDTRVDTRELQAFADASVDGREELSVGGRAEVSEVAALRIQSPITASKNR